MLVKKSFGGVTQAGGKQWVSDGGETELNLPAASFNSSLQPDSIHLSYKNIQNYPIFDDDPWC